MLDDLVQPDFLLIAGLVFLLTSVHVVADRFPLVGVISQERWLSAAAGVSTVYVFVFLLPKLLRSAEPAETGGSEQLLFALVFLGLVAFFALERIARMAPARRSAHREGVFPSLPVYWAHILSFTAYNLVIGYALVAGQIVEARIPFAVAMGFHLFANDEGLRRYHRGPYHRSGRWLLAGAIVGGALVGWFVDIGILALTVLVALLAGGHHLQCDQGGTATRPGEQPAWLRRWCRAVRPRDRARLVRVVPRWLTTADVREDQAYDSRGCARENRGEHARALRSRSIIP